MKTIRTSIPLLFSTMVLATATAVADPGFSFSVTMTGTNNGKAETPVIFKTIVSGSNGRVDIEVDKDDWKKGDYLVTTDGGTVFHHVSPKRKTVRRLDQAAVKAMMEKENKNLRIGTPTVSRTTPAPNREHLERNYTLSFREGLISGKGTIQEAHDYTRAEPGANVPTFNPMIRYLLMDVASLLLKDRQFESEGLASVLPKEFVTVADVRLTSEVSATLVGNKKQVSVVRLETSAITPEDIAPERFVVPAEFKAL
ncbi:MAG: hypothetical protein SFU56_17420 [Capsulimonadales bacterium]|nr:hypothetical protein [Capsulimonadales bacterium]